MPIETLEDKIYHNYDFTVSIALTKIYELSKDEGVIRLYWFERKYKSHLFLLRIALMARDIFYFPIVLEGASLWDTYQINKKIKKGFSKIKRAPLRSLGGINVPQFMEDLYAEVAKEIEYKPDFEKIYDTYYEGSLN